VHTANGEAKFWLEPEIELARNHRLRARSKINAPDGEGFLADPQGAKRSDVPDVHDLFATRRAGKKTSQTARLFCFEP
jgi:hypothetical protein